MPMMNGFELSAKIKDLDINPRMCFISSGPNKSRSIKRTVYNIEYRLLY
jgi:hypothetical protein